MPKREPLVSVIIPVWNTGKNVEKLIEQLFGQTYSNLEIIAIDDGSTDDSLRVLKSLAKKDSRLKVIHQENAGASAARNAGIRAASGKYAIFVDSDDGVVENYVEKLVDGIEAKPDISLAVVGMRMNKLQDGSTLDIHVEPRRGQRQSERRADYILELLILDGRMHGVLNKIFRLDVIREFDIKFEEGRDFAEDLKFVLDYLEHAPGEIEFILEPLYIYNFGTETSTVKSSSTMWKNWEKSHTDLKNWARNINGGRLYLGTRMRLGIVKLRWHVSHYRAKKRAKKS